MKSKKNPFSEKKRPYWRTLQEGKDYEFVDICGGCADVDIVMVTYNHAPYIRHAIESVLMQKTSFSYRLIIADDCSTDGTAQIVKEYREKYPDCIAVLLWNRNVGVRNNCITVERRLSARYVATLEGDDYWTSPYKIEKALSFLEAKPEFVGYGHNIRIVDENEEIIHEADTSYITHYIQNEHIFPQNSIAKMYQWKMLYIAHTSALVNRNYFLSWGEDTWEAYGNCREYLDVMRSVCLTILGDVYYAMDIMSAYRRVFRGTSFTANASNRNLCLEYYKQRSSLNIFCRKVYGVEFAAFRRTARDLYNESLDKVLEDLSFQNVRIFLDIFAREGLRAIKERGERFETN